MWYIYLAALCGELAVPCRLQAATVGQNTVRGASYGRQLPLSDVDFKVLCNVGP